jgi:hypothetical protein
MNWEVVGCGLKEKDENMDSVQHSKAPPIEIKREPFKCIG